SARPPSPAIATDRTPNTHNGTGRLVAGPSELGQSLSAMGDRGSPDALQRVLNPFRSRERDTLRCFTKRALEAPDPTAAHPIHSAELRAHALMTRHGNSAAPGVVRPNSFVFARDVQPHAAAHGLGGTVSTRLGQEGWSRSPGPATLFCALVWLAKACWKRRSVGTYNRRVPGMHKAIDR